VVAVAVVAVVVDTRSTHYEVRPNGAAIQSNQNLIR